MTGALRGWGGGRPQAGSAAVSHSGSGDISAGTPPPQVSSDRVSSDPSQNVLLVFLEEEELLLRCPGPADQLVSGKRPPERLV